MKARWKLILNRLRKPYVVLGIVSQITTILLLFKASVDPQIITTLTTAVCSILTLLGILSNPDAPKRGVCICRCEHCEKDSVHTMVNGRMTCQKCGKIID